MRHITDRGLQLIKDFEGFRSTIYYCSGGYPTIGYGHRIREIEKLRFESISLNSGLSVHDAEELLRVDVQTAERAVLRLITVPLSDGQFDALVSFTFNLGSGSLQKSTLRRVINRGEYDDVPKQLMRWIFSARAENAGLRRRRAAEALLFQSTK